MGGNQANGKNEHLQRRALGTYCGLLACGEGWALHPCVGNPSQTSSKAASRRPPERAHEIVQFLKRERLLQNGRCSDKRELLFRILLTQGINKFGAAGAGTAEEFQSDQDNVVRSLVAENAERFFAVWGQSNVITELVEHHAGSFQDSIFRFDHQNLHGSPPPVSSSGFFLGSFLPRILDRKTGR